jgi:hypothetical protein
MTLCGGDEDDLAGARKLINERFREGDFDDFYWRALRLVVRERAKILAIARELARPPHRLGEHEIMAIVRDRL